MEVYCKGHPRLAVCCPCCTLWRTAASSFLGVNFPLVHFLVSTSHLYRCLTSSWPSFNPLPPPGMIYLWLLMPPTYFINMGCLFIPCTSAYTASRPMLLLNTPLIDCLPVLALIVYCNCGARHPWGLLWLRGSESCSNSSICRHWVRLPPPTVSPPWLDAARAPKRILFTLIDWCVPYFRNFPHRRAIVHLSPPGTGAFHGRLLLSIREAQRAFFTYKLYVFVYLLTAMTYCQGQNLCNSVKM